jgi:hypothetical protein
MKRREILKPEVACRCKSLCRDSQPITTWLFGDELPKSIRDIAQVKRMSVKQFFEKRKFDGPRASTGKRFNQGRKCNFSQGGVRTKDRFFSPGTDFAAHANYILLRSYRINSNAVIFQFLLF